MSDVQQEVQKEVVRPALADSIEAAIHCFMWRHSNHEKLEAARAAACAVDAYVRAAGARERTQLAAQIDPLEAALRAKHDRIEALQKLEASQRSLKEYYRDEATRAWETAQDYACQSWWAKLLGLPLKANQRT